MTARHQVPDRTHLQRMDALKKGNEHRTKRKHLKRDLAAKRVDPVPLVQDPPEWLQAMKLIDFLIALPKVGRVKANKMLKVCVASPSKTLGGLSDRQRQELIQCLRGDR